MRESSNTTGIIFRTFSAKDADKVVHILNESGSREVLIAKGVGKPNSRKGYSIDIFNQVKLKLATGGGLPLITEVKLIKTSEVFRQSYAGIMFVNLICEIVDTFAQEEHDEQGYYLNFENLLIVRTVERLPLLAAALIQRYLHMSGNMPKLNEDVHSGLMLNESDPRYMAEDIGYTAEQSAALGPAIPDRIVKAQRFILGHDFNTIQKLGLTDEEQKQMLTIHVNWLNVATGKELRSLNLFLEAVA